MNQQIEKNTRVASLFFEELLNKKNISLYDELFHEDYQFPFLNNPDDPTRIDHEKNKKGLEESFEYLDWKCDIIETIAQDDKVAVILNITVKTIKYKLKKPRIGPKVTETSLSGEGALSEVGTSAKKLEVDVFHFKDGKITKGQRIYDRFSFYTELGILNHMVHHKTNQSMVDYIDDVKKETGLL